MKQRLAYIDNYRTFLIMIVITGHISGVYGGTGKGTWPYIEQVTDAFTKATLATFDAVILGFVLTSFFFVSGYFVPQALSRKGFKNFITDRFFKFSGPVLFYFFILSNINRYMGQTTKGLYEGDFIGFIQYSWSIGVYGRLGIMWFVAALLIFSIGYALIDKITGKQKWFNPTRLPSHRSILAFILLVSAFLFISRIWFPIKGFSISDFPFGSMVLFFLFFLLGALAYKGEWLHKLNKIYVRPWLIAVLFLFVPAILAIATGNSGYDSQQVHGYGTLHSLVFALWETVLGIGILMSLLLLFRNKINYTNRFTNVLSQSSFVAYIIHPTIIILVTVSIKSWVIFPLLKFLLASGIILIMVFSLSWLITRIPGVKKIV